MDLIQHHVIPNLIKTVPMSDGCQKVYSKFPTQKYQKLLLMCENDLVCGFDRFEEGTKTKEIRPREGAR